MCLPPRITVMVSAISSTSSNLCEMNKIVTPLSFNLFKFKNNSLTSCGTNTAVGSSKIKIFAPRNNTLIISTLCFSPTPSSSIIESTERGIPYFSVISFT